MLKTINLSKRVETAEGTLTILDSITLEIEAQESVAITGASGSGKSTLLGLMAGLDESSEGSIFLDGHEITAMDEEQRAGVRAQTVGFVFQSFQLLPGLTALENVMLPAELKNSPNAKSQAMQLLEDVGLKNRVQHYPNQLSGGEQQRVAIARAFASKPRILFADEPTGNLDSKTGEQIIDLLFTLNKEHHSTLVLVTHDQRLANRCNRVIHISDGALVNPS
ncbi:MAG: ABC transporter ATP-binding protein [Pseudomonadales bacterium]|jgi:putative ABC transport system ATP-binding protein|nr:ABC transporter ATP-binding protein [Pseudomonadales bacterium]